LGVKLKGAVLDSPPRPNPSTAKKGKKKKKEKENIVKP
jgi:hypothetical protein